MTISAVQNSPSILTMTPAASQQSSDGASPFADYFTSSTSSSDNAVQDFMEYAKETPAQRMFNDWLTSQNITMSQYNAMPQAEQTKLTSEYREYLKEHLQNELAGTGTAGLAPANSTTTTTLTATDAISATTTTMSAAIATLAAISPATVTDSAISGTSSVSTAATSATASV